MSEGKRRSGAKRVAELIHEAVDKGATTVEDIHKSIADLPLKILEEVEFLKKPVKEVRRIQHRSIGAVYDLIRSVNEQVGKLGSDVLSRSKPASAKRPATPRKRKAPSAPARPTPEA
jgi:hypothetical protein